MHSEIHSTVSRIGYFQVGGKQTTGLLVGLKKCHGCESGAWHGGLCINISSQNLSSNDCMVHMKSIPYSTTFLTESGNFIYSDSITVIGLVMESEWLSLKTRGHASRASSLPMVPAQEITAALARSPQKA